MNNFHKYDLPTVFHEWGHRVFHEEARIHPQRWASHFYNLIQRLGPGDTRLTGSKDHADLSRRAAGEGMVLLENDGVLPLRPGTKIALFGIGSLDYMKCGGGSGIVYSPYGSNLYHGFSGNPLVEVYEPITEFYYQYALEHMGALGKNCTFAEPEIPESILCQAAENADVAIITIYRFSGEGFDRVAQPGDFYLSEQEEAMLRRVTAAFDRSVVVLNTGAILDMSWLKRYPKVGGVLLAWQGGMLGGAAIADAICGTVNPSGKLTDTIASSYADYPSSLNLQESPDYVDYHEDIYVGYRYFETIPGAKEKVLYPFGYGLSYTQFAISKPIALLREDRIVLTVHVKNVGQLPGKEVVQFYYSAPQGKLGKSAVELAAFHKTQLLQPGEEETVTASFAVIDMASYDDTGKCRESAYVLEQGEYRFFAGNSCRDLQEADWCYLVEQPFAVVQQLTRCCGPNQPAKRMLADGSYEAIFAYPIRQWDVEAPVNTQTVPDPEKAYMFSEVDRGEISLDAFISQMTNDELVGMVSGIPCRGVSNTAGMGDVGRLEVPPVMTADGPAGIRLRMQTGIGTTAWPCATMLACTWNPELVYQVGVAGAMEAKENALAIWLAPGINIHRDPLCGRNFEYFSEDPLITGKMASAIVRGMQGVGTAASAKHFAANNKETNRFNSDSRLSERALREIYLRGFEICVREAQPWTVMTAYNSLNGVRCCENYELITKILRQEWGFAGMVTSDWQAECDQVMCVKAGNDVHMPYGYPERLKEALETGELTRGHLEACVKRVLEMILKLY